MPEPKLKLDAFEKKKWGCLSGHTLMATDAEILQHPFCRNVEYMAGERVICGLELGLMQELPPED